MEIGNNTGRMEVKLHDWSMIEVGHALCMHKKGWSFNFMVTPANLAFSKKKKSPLEYLQKSLSLKNCMCNLVATIAFSTLLPPYYSMCHLYSKKKIQCWCWIVTNTHIFGGKLMLERPTRTFSLFFIQLQHIVLLTSRSPSQPPNEVIVSQSSQSVIQNTEWIFSTGCVTTVEFFKCYKNIL